MRFSLIESMNRRAALHSGEARRIVDEKLSRLISDYARMVEMAECEIEKPCVKSTRTALAELEFVGSPDYPALNDLDYFRMVWTRLSTEKQLRHSLQQVPGN